MFVLIGGWKDRSIGESFLGLFSTREKAYKALQSEVKDGLNLYGEYRLHEVEPDMDGEKSREHWRIDNGELYQDFVSINAVYPRNIFSDRGAVK